MTQEENEYDFAWLTPFRIHRNARRILAMASHREPGRRTWRPLPYTDEAEIRCSAQGDEMPEPHLAEWFTDWSMSNADSRELARVVLSGMLVTR